MSKETSLSDNLDKMQLFGNWVSGFPFDTRDALMTYSEPDPRMNGLKIRM